MAVGEVHKNLDVAHKFGKIIYGAMRITPGQFENIGREVLQLPTGERKICNSEEHRRFRSSFGASFQTLTVVWNRLKPKKSISRSAHPKHLLWTMVYLKVHSSESNHCRIVGCRDRGIFRKWITRFSVAMADLSEKVIVWGNRFKGWNGESRCLVTVDGTDVKVNEPKPNSSVWWSHKHNSAGVKYEIATCIVTGDIVWFKGPFPCSYQDREIFDLYLSNMLFPSEAVEADSGYTGRDNTKCPGVGRTSRERKQKSQVRGRHENMNGRFKFFGVMKSWTNPDTAKHGIMAKAVALIVQIAFENGERLYDVPYSVNYD